MNTPPPLRVIISGSMGGIGKAIVQTLAQEGAKLGLLYHSTRPEEVASFLATLTGSGHMAVQTDLSNPESAADAVGKCIEALDGIDVCIHAATSKIVRKRASEISPEDFKKEFDVGVFGAFNLLHAIIPHFKEQEHGSIIAITSAGIEQGAVAGPMAGYLAAKHALRGLLRDLSQELSPTHIAVNAVAPGFVDTSLHEDLPGRVRDFMRERASVSSQDVAVVVKALLSSQITGMSYPVPAGEPKPL